MEMRVVCGISALADGHPHDLDALYRVTTALPQSPRTLLLPMGLYTLRRP